MAKGYGISEQTVGRWLRRSDRRDDIVLATKVYQPMGLGPNDRRLSEYHIRRIADPVDAADHHRRQMGTRTRERSLTATDLEHNAIARQTSPDRHHGLCARTR
jgi:diketogulonate reductase-like aldo/keto reductase